MHATYVTTRIRWAAAGLHALILGLAAFAGAWPSHAVAQASHVAVVQVDPTAYGPTSYDARAAAARAFYASHADAYDILIVFPTFAIDRSSGVSAAETEGRHFTVRNWVRGIGLPVGESAADFGSPQRLQGYVDIYALTPGDGQGFDTTLAVVAHEVAHQWSGAARFRDSRTGQVSAALLGLDEAHWSYYLDSDASVLYGADWTSTAGGTFTASASMKRYSALDLYLMGFVAPDEVGPITLLQPPSSATTPAASLSPTEGTRIPASPVAVTAADLVSAMGARVPASDAAQASFRAAFVIAAAPGQEPTQAQLAYVDAVRAEWANRFFFMTRGRAVMSTDLVELPPSAVASDPSVQLGLDYLLARQDANGSWADDPGTRVRDTQTAIEALVGFPADASATPAVARGVDFLQALQLSDVDQSSRRALALRSARVADAGGPEVPFALARANADGGFGLLPGYGSTVIDTALAVLASSDDSSAAVAYLESVQGVDGGWGPLPGSPSDLQATSLVLRLLSRPDLAGSRAGMIELAVAYLRGHRAGVAYLDDDSQDRTADVLLALVASSSLESSWASSEIAFLLSQQLADGSWEGSVERTAITLSALRALMAPNLSIRASEMVMSATSVNEGEPVNVAVLVRNPGYAEARDVAVQAFDDAGRPFGSPTIIPVVPAGGSVVANLTLDTSGHAGGPQAFVVVDPSGAVQETTEEDNRAAIALLIAPRPVLPDLYVASGSPSVSPSSITRVGMAVTVSAVVGNVGLTDVAEARLHLLSGATVIATRSVALPAGSSHQVTLEGTLPSAALSDRLTVVVDPDGAVEEARETNNSASASLAVVPTVDLAVAVVSVTPNPVDPGQDLGIAIQIVNRGTIASPSARSRAEILDGAGSVLATIAGPTLGVASGGAAAGTIIWRASAVPAAAVRVTVVHGGDLDPSDNVATASLAVSESGRPNLVFRGAPVVDPSPPLEGRPAQVTVTVENAGRVAAAESAVELWIGDPSAGGTRGPRVGVPSLASGATATLALPLSAAPGRRTALVARVDPDGTVAEYDETDNDAVLYLEPLARPDVAIDEGGVQPSSLFPRRGDQVEVRVVVQNLGGQPSALTVVELFAGAPELGGVPLGSTNIPGITANETTTVAFPWDTSDFSETVELVAVVNREGAIEDATPGNNRASRAVQVQAGDLAVSNPYFSPNGDGIKDETEVFYRLNEPGSADGVVRDERGRTVRVLHGAAAADATGALRWDGRTDAGGLAYDGTYHVTVQGAGQSAPLGEVSVVLDTDRSSVLDAPRELRSAVALDQFFQAQLPSNEPNLSLVLAGTPDERSAIFHYFHTKRSGASDCGFYRVPLDGDLPELLTPSSFACSEPLWLALSTDGGTIYRLDWGAEGWLLGRYDLGSQTAGILANLGNYTSPLVGPDGRTWSFVGDGEVVTLDLDTGLLGTGTTPDRYPEWAPGGGMQAFAISNEHGSELHVANADGTGERAVVVEYPRPACLEAIPDGPCIRYEPLPIATPEGAYVLPEDVALYTFTWVSRAELAFSGDGSKGVWLIDLTTGVVDPLVSPEPLPFSVVTLLADPPGRNLGIGGVDFASQQGFWAVGLASGGTDYTGSWGSDLDARYTFTRFGAALIAQSARSVTLPDWSNYSVSRVTALDSLGNLGLSITGLRRAGSPELVLRGTAADLNLDRWEITARQRRGNGTSIHVASGTSVVVDGELARWSAPVPGNWELTLTGTDLAGNTRSVSSVASWAEVPAIANVRAEPRLFSPNGDGRRDTVNVSYSVQEPVSTAFEVRDESGVVVRELPVTHASTGSFSLPWDGRGADGSVESDGAYTISTGGNRAEVILDGTPPEAQLRAADIGPTFVGFRLVEPREGGCSADYPPITDSQRVIGHSEVVPVLAASLELRVSDDHLLEWELQAARTAGFADPVAISSGDWSAEDWLTANVPVSALPGGWARLEASDAAGNQATTPVVEIPERLAVLGWGAAIRGDPGCGALVPMAQSSITLPGDNPFVSHVEPGVPLTGAKLAPRLDVMKLAIDEGKQRHPFCYEPAYHAFATANTIRAPLIGATIRYADGTRWVADQAHSRLMPTGAVLWDARTAPNAISALVVEVTDAEGRVFSAPIEIGYSDCNLGGGDDVPPDVDCAAAAGLGKVVVSAASRAPAEFSLHDLDTGATLPLALTMGEHADGEMYTYRGEVVTDDLPGCAYETLAWTSGAPGAPVPGATFDVCGLALRHFEVAGDRATVSLSARYRKPVARLDLYLKAADAQRQLVASIPGSADLRAPITFDLSPFQASSPLTLSARTVFTDGTVREEAGVAKEGACVSQPIVRPETTVQVVVAPRPPVICAARPSGWTVSASASSSIETIVDLGLELSLPGELPVSLVGSPIVPARSVSTLAAVSGDAVGPGVWTVTARSTDASGGVVASAPAHFTATPTPPWSLQVSAPSASANACPEARTGGRRALRVEGAVEGDELRVPRLYLKCGDGALGPVAYTPAQGALGEIDVTGWASRDCELMVEVEDHAGASYCSTPTPFHLVGNGTVAFSAAPVLFSPNGDGHLDLAAFTLATTEPSAVTVTGTDSKKRTGTALVVDTGAGPLSVAWDGTLDGAPAEDGDVTLRAVAVDPCGNSSETRTIVRVDTIPPRIRIDDPEPGARVSGTFSIGGEVTDANLLDYTVAIGRGASPTSFLTVGTFNRQAMGRIGEISTFGLEPDAYTIRVQARDRAGNPSTETLEVEVTSKQLIRSLAVAPSLVSPNHDGVLDASVASYATLAPATVSLELVAASGAVQTILPPIAMPAATGDADLLESVLAGVDDGIVTVRLTASSGGVVETEDALLTLDRVRPELVIEEPASGAVAAHVTAVRGLVDDDHLDDWTLTLLGDTPTVLATGRAPEADVLAAFADLAEGGYTLVLDARDAAGNHRELRSAFSVDRTPPDVALDTPAPDSWLTGRNGAVEVTGHAQDSHLADVRLEALVEGADPRDLYGAASLPSGGRVPWDVLSEADGPLQLRLVATDEAGNTGEAVVSVRIDNTPPVATLSAPRDVFVHPGDPITAVATDENLSRWTLELAHGPPGTLSIWVPLAEGSQSVEDGQLTALASLPADGTYGLRLTVVDLAGNASVDVSTFEVDTTPPRPPPSLVAQLQGPDVALSWAPSPDTDAIGYQVLRAGDTGAFSPSGGVVAGTAGIDPQVGDGSHRYVVIAIDRAGLRSAPSPEAQLAVDRTPPHVTITAPIDGAAVSETFLVNGTAYSKADFKEYRLSIGVGASPSEYRLVRKSGVAAVAAELGRIDAGTFADGTQLTIRLEGEDLSGNVAEATATVTVDDTAPSAPTLASALAAGNAVQLQWQASPDPDLLGYVVFRNGTDARAPAGGSGSVTGHLLPAETTSWVDGPLPDGVYTYEIQAYDRALNASALSNSRSAEIETQAPRATIASPEAFARLNGSVAVVAEVADQDVASVQFQVRAGSEPSFEPLGVPITRLPFTVPLDLDAHGAPVLELRAVATDTRGNVDPSPRSVFVFRAPRPAAPVVTTTVAGSDVSVGWSDPNPAAVIAGYEVARDGVSLLPDPAVPAGTATASVSSGMAGLAYDRASYTAWTASPAGRPWWRLDLDEPTLANALDLQFYAQAEAEVAVRAQGVWVAVRTGTVSGDVHVPLGEGILMDALRVTFLGGQTTAGLNEVAIDHAALVDGSASQDVAVAPGDHSYAVTAVSVFGLRSTGTAAARVYAPSLGPVEPVVATPVLQVTGSGATPAATVVVLRDGVPAGTCVATPEGAFSSDVQLAVGANTLTARATDAAGNVSLPSNPVSVTFDPAPSATLVLRVAGVHDSTVELAFEAEGDLSRISGFHVQRQAGGASATVAALAPGDRQAIDAGLPNGTYVYTVTAYNEHGIDGAPSNAVEASIAVAIPPVVAGLSVSQVQGYPALRLRWEQGGAPHRYLVERSSSELGPFAPINADRLVTGTTYLDTGLTPGVAYFYRVHAVDGPGNVGPPSLVAWGVPLSGMLARPSIFAPTTPDWPIDVSEMQADVSGVADPGVLVELRNNDVWVGETRAGAAELHADWLGSVSGSVGFGASPDGMALATGGGCCGVETLQVSGATYSFTIDDPGVAGFGSVVFSPDGSWFAFEATSTDDGRRHVWVVAGSDGVLRRVSSEPGEERAPAWAAQGSTLAYEAQRDAGPASAVGVLDVGTWSEQLLTPAPGEDVYRPAWTASGDWLALASSAGAIGTRLVRREGDAWQEVYASEQTLTALTSSRDGAHAALWGDAPGVPLVVVDLVTGEVSSTDSTPAISRQAVFTSDGSALIQVRDGEMVRTILATDETEPLGSVGPSSALVPTARGPVALLGTGEVMRYQYGGVFNVPSVPLFPGYNLIVATAIDGDGRRSRPSEPIDVWVNSASLADLAVISVGVLPAVPVAGDPVDLVVTIRNRGGVDAPASSLIVKYTPPGGTERELGPISIAELPFGRTTSAVVPLGAVTAIGAHQAIALADPTGTVPDAERQNNIGHAAFTVVASRGIQLAVSAEPAAVAVGGQFMATVTVQNPGTPVDATIVTRLADADGATVIAAAPAVYRPLPGGAATTLQAVLPVGTALAGDYQIVATLTPVGGTPLVASTPVTVQPEHGATLALAADRFRYAATDEVDLTGLVANTSRNSVLGGATYRLEVRDALGDVVWTGEPSSIPDLWLGGTSALHTALPAMALGAGDFSAHGQVDLDGIILAAASCELTISAAPALVATLAVAGQGNPPSVRSGDPASIDMTFMNLGTASSTASAGRLVLLAPRTGASLSSLDVAVPPLPAGASATQGILLPTSGLALDTYGLALVVSDAQGTERTLATAQLRVADGAPPALAVLSPAQGSVVPGVIHPRVRAHDGATGVGAVRGVAAGVVTPLSLVDGNEIDGTWSGAITFGPDGPYTIVFTGVDAEGNDGLSTPVASNPVALTIVSDRTPPELHVAGVDDGAMVRAPPVLQVSAADLHLASVTSTIDGVPYQPGTAYALEGAHVLRAVALDLAGNTATEVRTFTLDMTAPEVVIAGVVDGQYLDGPVTPWIVVTDPSPLSYSAALDGSPWSGASIGGEGRHVLAVDAEDSAGNTRHAEIGFWIDLTPPALAFSGVDAGACYAHPVHPVVSASDDNLGVVRVTLDGQRFDSGTQVGREGAHTLAADVRDLAGHRVTGEVLFTVDTTAPRIDLPEVDGRYFAQPVTLAYSVNDATATTVQATLDGAPFASGAQATAEGSHTLSIQAQDCAGNSSTRSATFVIDRTAPSLVLTGVLEGTVVAGPVSVDADAHDDNLVSVVLELDGAPYTPGSPIDGPGPHLVTGVATDAAGNSAHASLGFTIDIAAPQITIDGIADGDIFAHAVTPIVTVLDDDLLGWTTLVDGEPLPQGGSVTSEGGHSLVVTATDLAGNESTAVVGFVIDLMQPRIQVDGIENGVCYAHDVTPGYSAQDAHLSSVDARLDDVSFSSGTVVGDEGSHTLVITARDVADNVAGSSTAFVIDRSAPVVSLGELDGRYFAGPVTPQVAVTDSHLTSTVTTVDGSAPTLDGTVSGEGQHTLIVTAADCAGNSTTRTASFTIDTSPPEVVSSVAEGGAYAGPLGVTYGATDANLLSVTAVLDTTPFASGSVVTGAGAHVLVVTARDLAGNETVRTFHFEVTGVAPATYTVKKTPVGDELRVLVRARCGSVGDRSVAFLTRALPGADVRFVRTNSDLLVALRSGIYNVVVITNEVASDPGGEPVCTPEDPPPPLSAPELALRVEQELTEAVHRGVGLLVFRTEPTTQPWLSEALKVGFSTPKGAGTVRMASGDGSVVVDVGVPGGVGLVPNGSMPVGVFLADGSAAVAMSTFGVGGVVAFGFDPAVATPDMAGTVWGAAKYMHGSAYVRPLGVLLVRIEVTNGDQLSRTRVREHVDPALQILRIYDGGGATPDADIEWTVDQGSGATDTFEYLVRLPAYPGIWLTTSELARMVGGSAEAAGTYPLTIQLQVGVEEAQAEAERIAATIDPAQGDADARAQILARLGAVRINPGLTASDRETAIADLLDAAAEASTLQTVNPTELRIAIGVLIGVWEAR